eukprot:gene34057-biopygen7878
MTIDQGSSKGECAASPLPREPNPVKTLLAQQTALLNTVIQQRKDLVTWVEAAEEVAAKAASQSGGSAQSGEAELEVIRQYSASTMRLRVSPCELTGKVVRLCFDNLAVVAMLGHFTSRNPVLMRSMQRLWILLDLNDIELQARYVRSAANKWADRLSKDKDMDDRRLNRRRFRWA